MPRSAGGTCLLAHLPLNEQREIVEKLHYVKRTDSIITDTGALLRDLNGIREYGYAL